MGAASYYFTDRHDMYSDNTIGGRWAWVVRSMGGLLYCRR